MVVSDTVDSVVGVDRERLSIKTKSTHAAAEAARVIRLARSLQDLCTGTHATYISD